MCAASSRARRLPRRCLLVLMALSLLCSTLTVNVCCFGGWEFLVMAAADRRRRKRRGLARVHSAHGVSTTASRSRSRRRAPSRSRRTRSPGPRQARAARRSRADNRDRHGPTRLVVHGAACCSAARGHSRRRCHFVFAIGVIITRGATARHGICFSLKLVPSQRAWKAREDPGVRRVGEHLKRVVGPVLRREDGPGRSRAVERPADAD